MKWKQKEHMGLYRSGKALFLRGSPEEVKATLPSWLEGALKEVQGRARERTVDGSGVEGFLHSLEEGERYGVLKETGGERWRGNAARWFKGSKTSGLLLGFYRKGGAVRVGASVVRVPAYEDPIRMAYCFHTRGCFTGGVFPPEDEDLLARALAFPEEASLMERVDVRRHNLRALRGLLPPSLARPLAKAVEGRVHPKRVRVLDGAAVYREERDHLVVLDGKVHRLSEEDWALVQEVLKGEGLSRQGNTKGKPSLPELKLALTAVGLKEMA